MKSARRGEYAKTARRREEILDAAFDVFSKAGFASASMSEIAKRVGLTLPGLTHHFSTKEALLSAVLERRDLDANTHLEGREGLDLFRGLIEVAQRDEESPALTQLFAILAAEATDRDHPAHAYFRDRYKFVLSNVERSFEIAREQGHLRDAVDPSDAARAYVALSDGFQLQKLYSDGAVSQAGLIRRTLSAFITVEL
ncbi:TetR/AcrR family transcriptional regulator [Salinibacterium sp. SYSU T00001]|uniref:TetR/AcrR family transcriptional regulator n=1 Tax=Homoserinimonas sedimenticola TaxID=2986805 RepID=UPI00223570BA|nr:TetR/AcrR family transcriptional regulator [Salinibacterium sedimenticola]MCW4386120.1 TetR/AcrR family transcriptional regulator [Salinibacterium sedimenticola]